MSEVNPIKEYTREQVVDNYKVLLAQGVTNPFDILVSNNPSLQFAKADQEFIEWAIQRGYDARQVGTVEAELEVSLDIAMVYLDAGFTDRDCLEEISDWLTLDINRAYSEG